MIFYGKSSLRSGRIDETDQGASLLMIQKKYIDEMKIDFETANFGFPEHVTT